MLQMFHNQSESARMMRRIWKVSSLLLQLGYCPKASHISFRLFSTAKIKPIKLVLSGTIIPCISRQREYDGHLKRNSMLRFDIDARHIGRELIRRRWTQNKSSTALSASFWISSTMP